MEQLLRLQKTCILLSISCKQSKQTTVYKYVQCKSGREKLQAISYFRNADLLILQKAVESGSTMSTILIGDDTDLLILLNYHTSLESCNLFFKPEPKKINKNAHTWNVQAVIEQLGPEICTHILFLAIFGYDTTSQLRGIGKGNPIKKFRKQSLP